MIITAKFPSYCPVCREKIDVGEKADAAMLAYAEFESGVSANKW